MRTYEPAPAGAQPAVRSLRVGNAREPHEAAADRAAHDVVAGWADGTSRQPVVRRRAMGGARGGELDPATTRAVHAARRGGSRLERATRARMESAFGADFSRVRVHADRRAGELCDALGARAFTVGSDVFFRRGHPDPSTPSGRHLLAHELAHVTQRSDGVIRRLYIDGQRNWVKQSERPNLLLSGDKPRSPALLRIDRALERVRDAYGRGLLPLLLLRVNALRAACDEWKTGKLLPPSETRRTRVEKLKDEADRWSTDIPYWMGHGYRAALAHHKARKVLIVNWLNEGARTGDRRLRNSCEWLLTGRSELYILTETADRLYRAQLAFGLKSLEQVKAEGATAYIPDPRTGRGEWRSSTVTYNPKNATDNTNVLPRASRSNGWSRRGYVALTDTGIRQGQPAVFQTLRHEVQHLADRFRGRELSAGVRTAEGDNKIRERALRRYKTEYRAHFYQEADADRVHNLIPTRQAEDMNWTNRQLAIFNQIKDPYKQIKDMWDDPDPLVQHEFRRAVNQYRDPDVEGFNKYNSPDIDKLYNALHAVRPGTTDPVRASDVYGALRDLGRDDLHYVRDTTQSVMLRAKITRHLAGTALQRFDERVEELWAG